MKTSFEMYEKENGEFFLKNPHWGATDSPGKAKKFFELMQKHSLSPTTVAEVGCGIGGVLSELQKMLPPTTILEGYDISPDAIALAKSKENANLSYHLGNFMETDKHFDVLIMADVFEHVEDYYGFLKTGATKADYVLFSIPLDISFLSLLRPRRLKAPMQGMGHIHFFSASSALLALEYCDYKIIEYSYTSRIADLHRPVRFLTKLFHNCLRWCLGRRLATLFVGECVLTVLARSPR